jgi:hypothetical protein
MQSRQACMVRQAGRQGMAVRTWHARMVKQDKADRQGKARQESR